MAMVTSSLPSMAQPAASLSRRARKRHSPSVWEAPLVPAALAVTSGIVLDRVFTIPLPVSLLGAVLGIIAWGITGLGRRTGLPLLYLALSAVAQGAAYHHWQRDSYAPDDIGEFASPDVRPVQVRGVLAEEPAIIYQPPHSPLQSIARSEPTSAVLRVSCVKVEDDWRRASGLARLMVAGHLQGLHVGDEVEVVGRLVAPQGPANPGEADYRALLRDQHIRAQITVVKTTDGVTRLTEGWPRSPSGWLAVIRGWGQRRLQEVLPPGQGGVAAALLLGEGSSMTNEDWEKYIRTGVIHVLVISGQHLVILAIFLWWTLRIVGIHRSRGAWLVALLLLGYALLTGGRPPAMRAAVMVCVYCVSLILRRPTMLANSFALAWLCVALLNPTDIFNAGCQLSFLSVAILYWGLGGLFSRHLQPLDRLVEESRPRWQQYLSRLGRWVAANYMITLVIWIAVAPLVASRYHMISPIGILICPPLVWISSIALIAGFLLLLASVIFPPFAPLLGWITGKSLAACDAVVNLCDQWPAGHWYLGDIPDWWLWTFYGGLLVILTTESLRRRWRWAAFGGLAWLTLGLAFSVVRWPAAELRCTFLAVGHGGCTVLEAPDGRTLLYDAGTLGGPEVTRRQIAPFLWSRGIRRIDEVFLSHADLDHFNGLPALLERFTIGQVTCTPSFAEKPTAGVGLTLAALKKYGVPTRIARAGDRLTAGDVAIDVLHPPAVGPEGNENARSLVLLVRHAGHTLLLTGDLEGPGMERVLSLPAVHADILMAPHHGSRISNNVEFAAWARPQLVVSCEGPPRGPERPAEPYSVKGAQFLGTWPHGAVTIHSHARGLVIETFRSGRHFVIPGGR
jgi:competence protein ComEC